MPPGNYHTTFQARMVIVLTKHQLQVVLRRADFLGRVENWGFALGAYDIKYQPHTSI